MPYNSVTEHPGPLKLSMVGTLIFALVSKSVDRISKFALIKKLGKKFRFFGLGRVRHLGFRHLGFIYGYHSFRGCHGNGACCQKKLKKNLKKIYKKFKKNLKKIVKKI